MDSILSIILAILIVVFCIGGCMYGYPKYQVYKSDLAGQAQLKEAESNRKIIILEAEAQKESAALLAEVEITRAKGVAEANKIIGSSSLTKYMDYIIELSNLRLRYLPRNLTYVLLKTKLRTQFPLRSLLQLKVQNLLKT